MFSSFYICQGSVKSFIIWWVSYQIFKHHNEKLVHMDLWVYSQPLRMSQSLNLPKSDYTKAKACRIWCGLWYILMYSFPLPQMLVMNGFLFFLSCASSTMFLGTIFFMTSSKSGSGCSQNIQNILGNILFEIFEASI